MDHFTAECLSLGLVWTQNWFRVKVFQETCDPAMAGTSQAVKIAHSKWLCRAWATWLRIWDTPTETPLLELISESFVCSERSFFSHGESVILGPGSTLSHNRRVSTCSDVSGLVAILGCKETKLELPAWECPLLAPSFWARWAWAPLLGKPWPEGPWLSKKSVSG